MHVMDQIFHRCKHCGARLTIGFGVRPLCYHYIVLMTTTLEDTVQIYLLECHTWSDGEDDHEEDHNSYYDLKFFHVAPKCVYAWNVHLSSMENGLFHEWTSESHTKEIDDGIPCGTITKQQAISLIENELAILSTRKPSELLCTKVRDAMKTF